MFHMNSISLNQLDNNNIYNDTLQHSKYFVGNPYETSIKQEPMEQNDLLLTSGYYPTLESVVDPSDFHPPVYFDGCSSLSSDLYYYSNGICSPISLDSNYNSPMNTPSHFSDNLSYPHFNPFEPDMSLFDFFQSNDQLSVSTQSSPLLMPVDLNPFLTSLPVSKIKSKKPVTPMDARPFQCSICCRGFARKHDLQRHIRVHTGDKPYECPCCKKAFARTDALKRHLRMEEECRQSHQVQSMKASGRRKFRNL